MLTAEEVCQRTTMANRKRFVGWHVQTTELRVDPRTTNQAIAKWLAEEYVVQFCFNSQITSVSGHRVMSATGEQWTTDRIVIFCSGSDLQTLCPEAFVNSGSMLCKRQILRTGLQPDIGEATPHIVSGLTLRHYCSFESCQIHRAWCERIAGEFSLLDRFRIHVMASVFPNGEVVLGDSHEYGDDITPFDKSEIDELLLQELKKVICLENCTIRQTWHGIYAKHPTLPVFQNWSSQPYICLSVPE